MGSNLDRSITLGQGGQIPCLGLSQIEALKLGHKQTYITLLPQRL